MIYTSCYPAIIENATPNVKRRANLACVVTQLEAGYKTKEVAQMI